MKPKQKKIVRASRLTIDSRIFVKAPGESQKRFYDGINAALHTFNYRGRPDLLTALAEHPNLPSKYIPVYRKNTEFHGSPSLKNYISRKNYPYWMIGIFRRCSPILKEFIKLRQEVNCQILRGDAIEALRTLAAMSDISESWWSIETSIHINKELLGNDTKGYIKQLQDVHPNLNLSRITRDLLLLSESSNAQLYVGNVQDRLKEYMSSLIDGAAQRGAAESFMLLPIYHDTHRAPTLDALYEVAAWSVFDQYNLFRSLIMEMCLANDIPSEWRDAAVHLANSIGDFELLNVVGQQIHTAPFVENIVERYTRGEYSKISNDISTALSQDSATTFGLLEIYARTKIYTDTIECGTTFFDKLATEFAKILVLDSKSHERLEYLHRICVKFRHESWAKSLFYHVVSAPEPRLNDETVEKLRMQTACLGKYNTPKAKVKHFSLDEKFLNDGFTPPHRLLRYSKEVDQDSLVSASLFPIYSDYLKNQSRTLISLEAISEALNFSINEYLKNNVAFNFLSITRLAEIINATARGEDFDYISSLIILDIYGRECDDAFDALKTEIFEEYLDVSGDYRPSMLFSPDQVTPKVAYFLRNLCVPTQLDNVIRFNSNDEVIHERVAIIDLLISAKAASIDELRLEKDRVLENLFSEKLRAKIETGKLYVDVQALEAHRRHIYSGLFDQAKSLAGGLDLDPLINSDGNIDSSDLVQIDQESPVPVAVASSEKSNILVRIFNQAVNDFALNENYGLDKYLSAEIRHVVFETQLRSCFEKTNLVTAQKNGQYLWNDYWTQKYDFVPAAFFEELNIIFSGFSVEIDEILAKVNDRFRVKFSDLSANHVFDFCPYHRRIVRVSEIVKESETLDIFLASLISFMWELAVESARSAQELINDILLAEVLDAIDRLELKINELRGNLAAVDLMQAVRDCRSDFKKEVELVLNWFRFVGSDDAQTLERLGVVIEAAVSSFQAIFEHRSVELEFTQEKTELQLNYSEARALFISLFTALENALRYGKKTTPVIIKHRISGQSDELAILNHIATPIDDPVKFITGAKSKWTTAHSNLSTAEGGSGLYKIFNLLRNASRGFSFDIKIKDHTFSATIELNHEYFDNRR